jgi:hypothetical protein
LSLYIFSRFALDGLLSILSHEPIPTEDDSFPSSWGTVLKKARGAKFRPTYREKKLVAHNRTWADPSTLLAKFLAMRR